MTQDKIYNKTRQLAAKRRASRRRAGQKLAAVIECQGLDLRQIAKETEIDLVTLRNLRNFTPHLHTIETLSVYLERRVREQRKETLLSSSVKLCNTVTSCCSCDESNGEPQSG